MCRRRCSAGAASKPSAKGEFRGHIAPRDLAPVPVPVDDALHEPAIIAERPTPRSRTGVFRTIFCVRSACGVPLAGAS
jgi:hypothetical protein